MYHDPLTIINRSVSDFIWTKAPTREIDLAISWLENITHDCQFKITRLRALKAERGRDKAFKERRASVAALFDDPAFLTIDPENQIRIIQQRLGANCDHARAAHIRTMAISKLKRTERKERDAAILRLHRMGEKPQKIAAQVNLTRQQVYNIIKRHDRPLL